MQIDNSILELEVNKEYQGKRLDSFLAELVGKYSRTRLKSLIKSGLVTLDGKKIVDPAYLVNDGEKVIIQVMETLDSGPEPENLPLEIIFEDEDVIVVNKSAGMVVHPAAGHWQGTLVNALLYHCGQSLSGINGVRRPGIVHRLDKGTTGLLVAAKNDAAHEHLAGQFNDHGRSGPLRRTYKAIVWKSPNHNQGKIELNLSRSVTNRQKISVVRKGGRIAITHWKLIERFKQSNNESIASLIECRLETGRTHQIRVHMAHAGHPLLGDSVYGAHFASKMNQLPERAKNLVQELHRPALHAEKLTFAHPRTGKTMKFECTIPSDMMKILSILRII